MKKILLNIWVLSAVLVLSATASSAKYDWWNAQDIKNKSGNQVHIMYFGDGNRSEKYAVASSNNRITWYSRGGSANSGHNEGPQPTSHDKWCRVKSLYAGGPEHLRGFIGCSDKFYYSSFLVTGFNNKHYEIWVRPDGLSYWKYREQESGIWYAHDGSANDGRLRTSKDQWCMITIVQLSGILQVPETCSDQLKRAATTGAQIAVGTIGASGAADFVGLVNDGYSLVTGPGGFFVGKATSGSIDAAMSDVRSAMGLNNKSFAGQTVEIIGSSVAGEAIAAAMVGGGPAGVAAAVALSVGVKGTQALISASKDTTIQWEANFKKHPRFDKDINSVSYHTYPALQLSPN